MEYFGSILTCIATILVGLYLHEKVLGLILSSPLGFSKENQAAKNYNLQRLLQHTSSAFGAGAGIVSFIHGASGPLAIFLILLLCLLPAILFAHMRALRLGLIALETRLDQWISRPR